MTIDPYSTCPGGTGKKLKFCCSDLVGELDKIQRMIEGEQHVACLDHIIKLEPKYPERACLMALRSILELSLEKREEAAATIAAFLRKYPDNPLALARSALLKILEGSAADAVAALLRAIDASGGEVSDDVYRAFGTVALNLARLGLVIPARALLQWQFEMAAGKDERPATVLFSLQSDPSLPLLLKEEPELAPPPEGAPWKFEFDVAYQRAVRGDWKVAAEKFTALAPLAGQAPALWRNLALLRGWLADYPGMVDASRKYSMLDIPWDDAVDAEALAQLADPSEAATGEVELIDADYTIANQTDIEERFAADRQMERVPFDPRAWQSEDEGEQPSLPPRAIFVLLDRAVAPTAAGLTHDQTSRVLATLQLFGRQTDRPERLVVETERDVLANVDELLKRIAGDALGQRTGDAERVVDRIPPLAHALQWDWRLPKDATREQRESLAAAERRDRILNRLPKSRFGRLGDQTLEQAATNPSGRIRAAAMVLLLDLQTPRQRDAEVFNELRGRLGLPLAEPIDPATLPDAAALPVWRLHRMQVEKLSDDALKRVYQRAAMLMATRALPRLAAEVLRRPQLSEQVSFAQAHRFLALMADNLDEAVAHVEQGRAIAQKARQSSAPWDLEEMSACVRFGDLQGVSRVFDHIRKEHMREEGVAEGVVQILSAAGLVDSAGRVHLPAVAETSPSILVPGVPAAGKIITPDSVPAGEERRPVLWTPGMS
jgi:hypothetical protein